jgi:acetyl esterase/lipase
VVGRQNLLNSNAKMKTLLTAFLLACTLASSAQVVIPLYPDGKIPNSMPAANTETRVTDKSGNITYSSVSVPTLEIYQPEKGTANGTAVIICPGGGYVNLAYSWEGIKIALAFNKMGITAFVLKYRLPNDIYMKDKTVGPLQDAQMAIKLVRMRAKEWGIDTAKVGIAGFSAGGHLASTAATHFNKPVIGNGEGTNLRPSFLILGYSVISLNDKTVASRGRLLGENPSEAVVSLYSNDLQVTKNTPTAFIVHAGDDPKVKVTESVNFYLALIKNNVPAEMHIYPTGGHGFGVSDTNAGRWTSLCRDWMKAGGWVQ